MAEPELPEDFVGSKRRARTLVLALTAARIPLAFGFAFLYWLAGPSWSRVAVAFVVLLAMELSDAFDGYAARRLGVVSEWGAMLDPYADSFSRLVVFWTLASAGHALWLTVLVMALRDVTVSYCRVTLTRFGRTVKAKASGKVKAIVQAVVAHVLVLGPVYEPFTGRWAYAALSWLVILVTAASAVEYVAGAVSVANERAGRGGADRGA
jgi:CDP-diacylglycerol--glycerol-3-phosphate 3-phosphatidyltransferase